MKKEVTYHETDRKSKKRLTLAGLGVVCVVLVIAIASQFKAVAPKKQMCSLQLRQQTL
jgi:hypothetical protein